MSEITQNLIFQARDQISGALGNIKNSLKQVGSETEKTAGRFSFLKDAMSTAAGVMIRDLSNSAARSIGESVKLGASVGTLQNAFDKLVSASGAENLSLKSLRKATRGTVSDISLLTSANKALQLGVPAEELNSLFAAAMRLGPAMGRTVTQAVDDLSTGIGRQSKLIMDNVGITFDVTTAYELYAQQLGVTVGELDESEKKLAWQAYAMEQVCVKGIELGDVMSDAQVSQQQFAAATENAKTKVGEAIGPFGNLVTAIQPILPMLGTMTANLIPDLIKAAPKLIKKLGEMKLGWEGVAIGAAGFVATLTLGESILNALPENIRGIASALMLAIGAIVAATVAWLAFHTTMTFGTAAAIILPAVALGITGLKGLLAAEGLAEGGIVTKPTVALLGERGPEAVIPLGRPYSGPQLREINITQYNTITNEMDLEDVAKKTADYIAEKLEETL